MKKVEMASIPHAMVGQNVMERFLKRLGHDGREEGLARNGSMITTVIRRIYGLPSERIKQTMRRL